VVLHRHQRWHQLTLAYLGPLRGLLALHFMSERRGMDTVREWLLLGRLLSLE
jgi:hypothetical protein